MKTRLLILAGLIGVCCLISCEKAEDTLPKLEIVDDVCTKMDDMIFMECCYYCFDKNKDGKVSMEEASAVELIGFGNSSIVSYTGIEYFSNLEFLLIDQTESHPAAVKTLDLNYNKHLRYILIQYANRISSLDLRPNTELKNAVRIQYCTELVSVYLPKSIETIPTRAFEGCDKLSVVDMSQCVNLKEIEGAFNGYTFPSNIDVFLIGATVPPKTSDRSFEYNSIKTLKVPAESVEAYKKSSWKHYASEIKPIDK